MGLIKRALRRTSRKLLSKIIPPSHSQQLVLNPQCTASNVLAAHGDQMGSKRKLSSFQRRFRKSSSKDTAVAEALLLAVKNHLPPLQFHHIHGPHAQLSVNKCVARRTQSFCQALVFSNRVILPNERVYIKVLEISKNWSGTIRFGFTAVDPATLACRVPKHACPDMTNAGHTWARALADEVVRRNSVIHFSYTKNGIIHYGINNQDCGIFHANVGTNQNLWFIVDIYGLTAAIELIDPRVNNAANNELDTLAYQLGQQQEQQAGTHDRSTATMYKSTSAMDELFGGSRHYGQAGARRRKLSRKHARHAALIHANWPLENYSDARLLLAADNHHTHPYHEQQPGLQLPNLNSVALPSCQQNIYSPMPNLAHASQQHASSANNSQRTDEPHDYHQILGTYLNSSYQPVRMMAGASTRATSNLTGSISLANIAHLASSSADEPSPNGHGDLSQQFDSMHLEAERRHRKRSSAAAKSIKSPASSAGTSAGQQTPVAAARKRPQLQPIQNNLKRTPEQSGRDQPDRSGPSAATHRRIIPASKTTAASSAVLPAASAAKTAASSHAGVKPKVRHSIKTQKSSVARDNNSNDNSSQSKDCPICFERPINCVLYQCGHMCTCYECGVKQWKTQSRTCPICRTVIKDVIKTYLS